MGVREQWVETRVSLWQGGQKKIKKQGIKTDSRGKKREARDVTVFLPSHLTCCNGWMMGRGLSHPDRHT